MIKLIQHKRDNTCLKTALLTTDQPLRIEKAGAGAEPTVAIEELTVAGWH
jgi:hypothetical protein